MIGNLTRDPELSSTPNGVDVCKFSIAVSRDYADNEGNRETDFFNIVAWRGKAEVCGKYLKKGNKVAVIGSIQIRSYEDKDGIKRTITEIVASDVEFLTPKASSNDEETSVVSVKRDRPQLEVIEEELPF